MMGTLNKNPIKIKQKSHSIERRGYTSNIRSRTRSQITKKLVIVPLPTTPANIEENPGLVKDPTELEGEEGSPRIVWHM
jgi:hypothetical protein